MMTLRNRGGVGMVLLDSKLAKSIPALWAQGEKKDPVAYLKLFTVTGWSWYVLELDPVSMIALCYVTSPGDLDSEGEFGTENLKKLADFTFCSGALGVERSLGWEPAKLSAIKKGVAS